MRYIFLREKKKWSVLEEKKINKKGIMFCAIQKYFKYKKKIISASK